MPRQSYHHGQDDNGFERPALKNSRSAMTYSTTSRPGVPVKSSFSMSEAGGRIGSNSGSLGFFRSRGAELPLINPPPPQDNHAINNTSTSTSSASSGRHKMRAAMSSSGREGLAVLPDWSRTSNESNNNNNIIMHMGQPMTIVDHGRGSPHGHADDYLESTPTALRQRKPMEGDSSGRHHNNGNNQRQHSNPNRSNSNSNNSNSNSNLKNRHKLFQHDSKPFTTLTNLNLTQILQMVIFLLVTFLLYDSHHKSNLIANRLGDFKSEEAMLFLHINRLEQQSIQLHQVLQRFDNLKSNPPNNPNNINDSADRQQPQQNQGQQAPSIDSALIDKQLQQLREMDGELSHEVRTLQARIQHSAVRSIVHEFGEGPVQVIWEVVMDGVTSKVSILLWHDTPHAAWTWLEQISKKQWDGAQIHLENNRIMNVGSGHTQVAEQAKLDFIERSQQRHQAWTVGLSEPSLQGSSDNSGGGLQVFINLQDNTEFSKHNVCIGKVFDGFDVLHKMVEQSRQMQQAAGAGQGQGQGQGQAITPITIRTARASHLTNRETKGLI